MKFINSHFILLCDSVGVASVMTSQLLLLYYLLLYEDVRLNNMNQLVVNTRHVHSYSPHLFTQLPIRYLLSHAQKEQRLYAGTACHDNCYSSLCNISKFVDHTVLIGVM